MLKRLVVGSLSCTVLLAVACSTAPVDDRVDKRVEIPEAPDNGFQLVFPEMEVEPGTERQWCWYTTLDNAKEEWVNQTLYLQDEHYGHHVAMFLTSQTHIPDGTIEDCTEFDAVQMAGWEPILAPPSNEVFELPEDLAVRLPPSHKVVFQSHYVNYSDDTIRVRDVVNVWYSDGNFTATNGFAANVLVFEVPPGESTLVHECTVERELKMWELIGHMHEWGKATTVEIGPPDNLKEVYRVDEWTAEFRDEPPAVNWPVSDPLILNPGDTVRTSCTWNNTENHSLDFPQEMCVAFGWVYPADTMVVCNGQVVLQ